MAIAVVHDRQTGGPSTAFLAIASAAKGNLLVAFITQSLASPAPTGKDNISGSTGWTVNATKALYAASVR